MTKVLIEPYINNNLHGYAIQAKKFSLDLKITNQNNEPTEEFTISSVVLKSSEGQDIAEDFGKKSFFVTKINPGESQLLHIAETGQFMYGLVSIDIRIRSSIPDSIIKTVQKNSFTNECVEIDQNKWIDFIYIKSAGQHAQELSSKRVMQLAWATVFLALIQIIVSVINFNL